MYLSLIVLKTGELTALLCLIDVLNYVLPHVPASLLQVENTSGKSSPLHWAAVNAHLAVAQAIVLHPGGPGPLLIDARNAAGLSPLGEAELAGADDVAKWLVEVMMIEQKPVEEEDEEIGENDEENGETEGSRAAKSTDP